MVGSICAGLFCCLVSLSPVLAGSEPVFRRTEGALVLSYGLHDLALVEYQRGELSELWSTEAMGHIVTASLVDIVRDDWPEVIVSSVPTLHVDANEHRTRCLLIYGNRSGEYALLLNRSMGEIALYDSYSQVCSIDYYGNGTDYAVCLSHGEMVMIGTRSGSLFVEMLAESLSYDGFGVGDVNGDGRDDIVHGSAGGFTVLENQGGGTYQAVEVSVETGWFNDLQVKDLGRDLGRDGVSEIIVATCCSPRDQILCIWGLVDGEYVKLWGYNGTGTEDMSTGLFCVEAGDMDGDGLPELLTSTEYPVGEGEGLSVWEQNGSAGPWIRARDFGPQNVWRHGCLDMAVLDPTGLARGLGVSESSATSIPLLHLVLWEMGEYTHLTLKPQLTAGGAIDVWPLKVGPSLTARDLGVMIADEERYLVGMADQDLAEMLLEVVRAAENLLSDENPGIAGPLVLAVSDALAWIEGVEYSDEARAIIGAVHEAVSRAVSQGWYGSMPHILEAGFALAELMDQVDEIRGGYLLVDQIWEGANLLSTKPTMAMDIAQWCSHQDVRELLDKIHWIQESWRQVEATVSERDLRILQGLLEGILGALDDRNTPNCVARMDAFQQKLDQLGVTVKEPANSTCFAFILIAFLLVPRAIAKMRPQATC